MARIGGGEDCLFVMTNQGRNRRVEGREEMEIREIGGRAAFLSLVPEHNAPNPRKREITEVC